MRILILILTVLFATALIAVMLMNSGEIANVKLWNDPSYEYRDVPLGIVLFFAVFAGFVFTGVVAVIEGMRTRLDNARLQRRVRRIQQELDSIRTPAFPLQPDEGSEPAAAVETDEIETAPR